MNIEGKVVAITGGASGIGKAVAKKMLDRGANKVFIADINEKNLYRTAEEIGAFPILCDVSNEDSVKSLVKDIESQRKKIDIFMSNAGIYLEGDENAKDLDWMRNWSIHVMAHVYAARAVLPGMIEQNSGYLINTSSAAGLLTHIDSATYSTTKHAAIGFAEYLSINYGAKGVKVSVLCPQAVRTAMTLGREDSIASIDGMLEPDFLAEIVLKSVYEEEFLILPHPEVLTYMRRKTSDYERWLLGMRRFKARRENQ
ncbi:MAG: SDR family oxidoreductase [Pseudomonadota bacterium]|nr:SDR family oxidoreductase [Pseudomonadota bacterium]